MPRRTAGEGTIKERMFKKKDGSSYKRWFARITIGWDGNKKESKDGPLRSKKAEAHQDLKNLLQLHERGELRTLPKQSFGEFLQDWLEQVVINKKYGTYRTHKQTIDTYIVPQLGHIQLNKIKRSTVQKALNAIFKDFRSRGKDGRAIVRKCRAAIHEAFEYLIDEEPAFANMRNPAKKVEIPSETTKEIEPWTKEEAQAFFDFAKTTRYWPLIYTALTSGLREGELLALRWNNLSIHQIRIQESLKKVLEIKIKKTLVMVPKKDMEIASLSMEHLTGRFFLDTPKTAKSQASVLVAEDTLKVLFEQQKALIEKQMKRLGSRYQDFNLVFPTTTGVPMDAGNMLEDYKAIIKQAGVRYITFHDLRDTHASRLQAMGKELAVVSERLRHSKKSTTADKYTHLLSNSKLEGAVTLEQLFER